MPAYRERVFICPMQDGQPCRIAEFPYWWRRREFFEAYGHRRVDVGNPLSEDYGLLLAGWEASAWDRKSRDAFAQEPRGSEPFAVEAMREWEMMLRTAGWVIVESYEWESGLE